MKTRLLALPVSVLARHVHLGTSESAAQPYLQRTGSPLDRARAHAAVRAVYTGAAVAVAMSRRASQAAVARGRCAGRRSTGAIPGRRPSLRRATMVVSATGPTH